MACASEVRCEMGVGMRTWLRSRIRCRLSAAPFQPKASPSLPKATPERTGGAFGQSPYVARSAGRGRPCSAAWHGAQTRESQNIGAQSR